jgi:hypothetical protein
MTRALLIVTALFCAAISAPAAFAQAPPQANRPQMQVAAQPAPAQTPMPGPLGLCQCLSDVKNLDFTCPGSAEACESSCGRNYSYVPTAQCRQN